VKKNQILILAAGHNKQAESASSLWSFSNGKSILDWQIFTFKEVLPESNIRIAVGYDYEKIVANHPELNFSHVLNWENGSALQSFLETSLDYQGSLVMMYGDTIFHPETIEQVSKTGGDVVIAIDSVWKERFKGRSKVDISIAETLQIPPHGEVEYTGLIKMSPKVMKWISNNHENYNSSKTFVDLINDIRREGFEITTHDVAGNWAEMNEPNDLVRFILGTKAETLSRIQPQLKKSKICDQFTCTWNDWKTEPSFVIDKIQGQFKGQRLILRSSTAEEDSWETANAGVFESILDVDCDNSDELQKSISQVFSSYEKPITESQILIQPYVTDIAIAGVIFTSDLISGSPYYIINYDDVSGRTDTVTSGNNNKLRTVVIFHSFTEIVRKVDARLEVVIEAAKELETILGFNKLDIEFAIDKNGQVYTFQVRPIAVKHDSVELSERQLVKNLDSARQNFVKWQKKPPHIKGEYTIFSGMSDWNPAEIIGNRPNSLAISLYRHLITDDIWAKQRAEFGYRDVRPSPLVHSFCSQPYVDCRASINSFFPNALPDDVSERLINLYLDVLHDNPHLHDKIELDVVFTIWVPTFWKDVEERFKNRKVIKDDLKLLEKALKKITSLSLERLDQDIESIRYLSNKFNELVKSDLDSIEKAFLLIDHCREYGTLAFSHAARAGFIAIALLKSLVKLDILSQDRMLEFQSDISTVAGEFQEAITGNYVSIDNLISNYGHLRPGTYDINQMAYWENPDFYFKRQNSNSSKESESKRFKFTEKESLGLKAILDELDSDIGVEQLIQYFTRAIQERERTKFEFSKYISATLDLLVEYGKKELNLSREEIGFLTYEDISGLRTGNLDAVNVRKFIKLRQNDVLEKQLIKLPGFISSEDDFFGFEQEESTPNFITHASVIAELAFIESTKDNSIQGKIIAIPNADPGFDWIFSHSISGLITQYGGANSHMAIRCAELGIPAAIGVGDKVYESLKEGRLKLDCLQGQLEHI